MNKENFGIIFTDASFDHNTKTSTIGIFNISNKKEYTYIVNALNPTDAEKKGLKEAIRIAEQEKIFNAIFICDNKEAINTIRKEYLGRDKINNFWYIQFLWIPREYNQLADFLSKNLNEDDIEAYKKIKEEAIVDKKEYQENKIVKSYVKNIDYVKQHNTPLLKRIEQFKALYEISDLNKNLLKSKLIKELLSEKIDLNYIEELFLDAEDIALFEKDLVYLKESDALLSLSASIIKDLILFI